MNRRLSLVALVIALGPAWADDWTGFRGPGGSGVSGATGLPTTWSSIDNILWRTTLPGPGGSSPIVVGKRIYLTCYSGYGIREGKDEMANLLRHVVCIDRERGAILWVRDFKPLLPESRYEGRNETQHGYATSTLASDGKCLYAFFGKSGVSCLDLDGNEIWKTSVGKDMHGWASANSPVLFRDLVIVNACIESDSLVALDKSSGKEVWRFKRILSSWNTPLLVEIPGGGTELVVSELSSVIGFDPASGKELWRVTGFTGYACPSAVADKGIVYVVRSEALAIRAGGRGDVTDTHVLWRKKGSSLVSSPVLADGLLVWAGAIVSGLDAATGSEVYRGRLSDRADFYASPIFADGKIYCTSRYSGTFVLAAGRTFKELANNRFDDDPSRSNASPIVSDGALLLRTDQALYCIGKK